MAGGEEERQRFLEDKLTPYHALLDLLAGAGRLPEALAVAERAIGLSWAFALAGSPNVVASHWKVDERSTTELMAAFHRHLRRSGRRPGDVAEALRQAARALRRDARYRHPFYWAGFFLTGSGAL